MVLIEDERRGRGGVGEIELSVIHITGEIDVFMDYITKRKEVDNERGGGPKTAPWYVNDLSWMKSATRAIRAKPV